MLNVKLCRASRQSMEGHHPAATFPLQVPYSGFGMMSRVVLTIAASRVLRVASFMCTVLPNPRPGCYARRFPPVPDGLWETIKV